MTLSVELRARASMGKLRMPEIIRVQTCWKLCNDLSGNCTPMPGPPLTIRVSLYDIGLYSVAFAEKWLLVPGRHYRKYVYSSLPSIYHAGMGISRTYTEQVSKSYSGDVSGILGESLSILALERAFWIDPYKVAHLRPIKRNIKCPDFIIHRISQQLKAGFRIASRIASGLSQRTGRSTTFRIPRRIPLESKASVTGNLNSAVGRAISQLHTFWENDRRNIPLSDRWGLISFASLMHAAPHLSLVFVVPLLGMI